MSKVMVTMPEKFLKQIDRAAATEHRTRSEYIREALRERMGNRHVPRSPLLNKPNVQWALQVQARAIRKRHSRKFDSTVFIRKLRGPLK